MDKKTVIAFDLDNILAAPHKEMFGLAKTLNLFPLAKCLSYSK